MDNKKIRVAITHGDTNGIGYELIFKTFAEPEMLELCTPIVYGSPKVAAYYRKAMNLPAQFSIIQKAEDAEEGRINLLAAVEEEVKVDMGVPTEESGQAAVKALDRAMTDFRDDLYDVLVTAPINSQNAFIEGFAFKGHKHYIETCLGEGKKGLSILVGDTLRIASVTEKLPLKEVAAQITAERIVEKATLFQQTIKRDFNISNPRIAVLALNPRTMRRQAAETRRRKSSFLPSTSWQARAYRPSDLILPTTSSAMATSESLTVFWPCITTRPQLHSSRSTTDGALSIQQECLSSEPALISRPDTRLQVQILPMSLPSEMPSIWPSTPSDIAAVTTRPARTHCPNSSTRKETTARR